MKALVRIFIAWIPLGIAVTGLSILVYLGASQVIWQSFTDVSVQMAEDTVALINSGVAASSITFDKTVNIRESIAPFAIIFDRDGNPLSGNGALDGQVPVPPQGVFENVGFWRWGQSWQPDEDVRINAAVIPFKTGSEEGFVLGGRNMHLMQDHIVSIGTLVFEAWLGLMAATFLAKGFARYFS